MYACLVPSVRSISSLCLPAFTLCRFLHLRQISAREQQWAFTVAQQGCYIQVVILEGLKSPLKMRSLKKVA